MIAEMVEALGRRRCLLSPRGRERRGHHNDREGTGRERRQASLEGRSAARERKRSLPRTARAQNGRLISRGFVAIMITSFV